MKRMILSAMLVGATVFSLAAPAFADRWHHHHRHYPPPPYRPGYVYAPPPPVVYAPPPDYAPPPSYPSPQANYAPPQGSVPYGGMCFAGAYSCAAAGPVGSTCSCPGIGAPSFGTIH